MKNVLRPLIASILLSPLLLGNAQGAGCSNAFSESANKKTPEAILFTARQQLDSSDWTSAIVTVGAMAAADRDKHDARIVEASAYAGRCGLRLIDLANNIVQNVATSTLMAVVMSSMKTVTSYSDCSSAEERVSGIPAAEMTVDDWVFYAFLEFAKTGAVLEAAGADSDHNGITNGFSGCSLSRVDATAIGASLNQAILAINNSGIAIAGAATASLSALCVPGSAYPCGKTSGFTDPELAGILTLVHTSNVGLNTCPGPFPTGAPYTCACAPPP